MKRFLILATLLVVSSYASADVSSGYKYPGPSSGSGGYSYGGGGGLGSSGLGGGYSHHHSGIGSYRGGGGLPGGVSGGFSGAGNGFGSSSGSFGNYRDEEPLINKHFYIHSAPEDHDSSKQAKHFTLGRAQKNYRVVFIKAPSSSDANTKLSAEYAPSEEKTVIYVLSQKEHEIDANDIATPAPTQPSKPEVHFVKYRTEQEAIHAQQQIQAQYDALGGQSEVSDEGTAPVSSVVGIFGDSGHHGGRGGHGGHGSGLGGHGTGFGGHGGFHGGSGSGLIGAGTHQSNTYLPPGK